MIRLYILLALLVLVWAYWVVPRLQPSPGQWLQQRLKNISVVLVIAIIVALIVTGRLSVLIGLLGLLGTFLMRALPLLVKYAPYLQKLWVWRQQHGYQSGAAAKPVTTAMSREQALEILGLQAGASEADIIQAHRQLMARVHPDKGGSNYLAAQINLAKQTLLRP